MAPEDLDDDTIILVLYVMSVGCDQCLNNIMKSGHKIAMFESDLILFLTCSLCKFGMESAHSTRCTSEDSFLID